MTTRSHDAPYGDKLTGDALRLLAVSQICDEIGGIDLHARSCELAGGNEPRDVEYLQAIREAMDIVVRESFGGVAVSEQGASTPRVDALNRSHPPAPDIFQLAEAYKEMQGLAETLERELAERDELRRRLEAPCEEVEEQVSPHYEEADYTTYIDHHCVPADYARDLYRKWQEAQFDLVERQKQKVELFKRAEAAEQRAAEAVRREREACAKVCTTQIGEDFMKGKLQSKVILTESGRQEK